MPIPSTTPRWPRHDAIARVCFALLWAAFGGLYAAWWLAQPDSDFEYFWTAARVVLAGQNPYDAHSWPLPDSFWYPLPVALLLTPLAWLPMPWAGGLFIAASTFVLALALTRDPRDWLWPMLVFASPAYAVAAKLGQWTPLLVAGLLWPALAPVLSLKPSLGLALWLARPSRWAVAGGLALAAAALVVRPAWPLEWLAVLRAAGAMHAAPVTLPGGVLLLAAASRWRRPEARLLFGMACVPQVFLFADQLPLALIPRTPVQRAAQALLMWVAYVLGDHATGATEQFMFVARPYVMVLVYGPALVMVLCRPNHGPAPAWLERALASWRVPARLAGRSEARTAVVPPRGASEGCEPEPFSTSVM